MKFKELKERIGRMSGSKLTGQEIAVYYRQNPNAKKAAKDPKTKKAIEFALDHGGAMNYAMKEIEKIGRGLSKHPEVKRALDRANFESVDEGKYSAYSDLLVMKARIIDKEGPKSNKLPAVDDAIRIAKKKLGIKEGKMDNRERQLNYKLKELEYKMKLKDFVSGAEENKGEAKESTKAYGDSLRKIANDKKLKALSKSDKDKLAKIADMLSKANEDTQVEPVKEKLSDKDKKKRLAMIRKSVEKITKANADKARKDALKMMKDSGMFDEDAGDHKHPHKKKMKESVLNEAMSKPMGMKDVRAIEKKYNEKMSQAEIDDYLENHFDPSNSARPDAWLALGYPVRSGDYYFALIGRNKATNIKNNQKMNDQLKKMKPIYDDPDALYDAFMDWNYKNIKNSGVGDTMTREEVWASVLHIMKKRVATVYVDESVKSLGENFFTKLFKRLRSGIRNLKPKNVPKESNKKESKKTFKEARMMKRSDVMRKHGRELKKVISPSSNSFDLSDKAEEDLIQYVMDNYPEEIPHDDPDVWMEWLDDNLEDFVKGRGYK